MKIAVLGWGSLIWDRDTLKIVDEEWNEDGPELPIEFARMSGGGRLTLVIKPNWKPVRVLYSTSAFEILESAIENLRNREGTSTERIGFYNFQNGDKNIKETNLSVFENILAWNKMKDFDAIIWTDLPPNFRDKLKLEYTLENISKQFVEMSSLEFSSAKEYIEKAPKQIQTEYRSEIEKIVLREQANRG
ncbi:hypothetical protein GCM10022289_01330 [Pedobacter jeongneungensis]|uniref:Uncharacterized protein n=1 Tax=Pedobacter jeongneungensis TaxID=947309 RepID=A0ABP8B2B5_9SPHI